MFAISDETYEAAKARMGTDAETVRDRAVLLAGAVERELANCCLHYDNQGRHLTTAREILEVLSRGEPVTVNSPRA